MLLELKASQLEREEGSEANTLQELEKLLTSKDFENALKSCLTACMLSPNLTAYVTDTHQHVMEFIQLHNDLFKITEGVFNDTKLCSLLGKLVTRLLSMIHGQIKTMLTTSITKRSSIMDALKPLIHSGMEVDSSHWTRFAFLDHEKVTLGEAFLPYLIPSLHQDLQQHIETMLKVNMDQLMKEFSQDHPDQGSWDEGENSDTQENLPHPTGDVVSSTRATGATEDPDADPASIEDPVANLDENGIPDEFLDTPNCVTSGFGLDGGLRKWNKQKFWNYIDAMLEQIHETAHQESNGHAARYEDAYRKTMVEFLQLNLQEFPGHHKVLSLSKGPQPAWQETIQKKLLW
ncbi:hypothetical protein EDD22DRAFT_850532 [Suillus occidentalis]|nr:hypothetical protein EDD22DRAFT_850532 [Suillus occidentalis]